MSLNIDLPARLDELRRDRTVLICDDSIASVARRYALALGDDPAWHAAQLELLCAPRPPAKPTAIAPPHSVTDYAAGADGWLRITRRPAPPPLACGVCGTTGAPHAHYDRGRVTTPRPRCATCGAVADLICPRHGWTEAQPAAPSPETDWRPLPSCAEVLAHSACTGGEAFAPWLRLPAGDSAVACVVMLAALDREATLGVTAKVVVELLRGERLPYHGDTYRPITRRGEALPWPEVPR